MASLIEILIISVSLALDAVSVSIAGGLKSQQSKTIHAIKVAAFFGVFQAVMPLIGWYIGEMAKNLIQAVDHWVAFGLLTAIGIKMIHESLHNEENAEKKDILNNKTLIILSIATSIDALIVGVTIGLLQIPLLVSVSTIGIVTFILCFLGFIFGKQIGTLFGKRIEILGGIALIGIGIKILLEHLLE